MVAGEGLFRLRENGDATGKALVNVNEVVGLCAPDARMDGRLQQDECTRLGGSRFVVQVLACRQSFQLQGRLDRIFLHTK